VTIMLLAPGRSRTLYRVIFAVSQHLVLRFWLYYISWGI